MGLCHGGLSTTQVFRPPSSWRLWTRMKLSPPVISIQRDHLSRPRLCLAYLTRYPLALFFPVGTKSSPSTCHPVCPSSISVYVGASSLNSQTGYVLTSYIISCLRRSMRSKLGDSRSCARRRWTFMGARGRRKIEARAVLRFVSVSVCV